MRQALGRGIAALIPTGRRDSQGFELQEAQAVGGDAGHAALRQLSLEEIDPNPRQPRATFSPEELSELARSITQQGVLQPILVRRLPGGRFELIAGERRLRAARLAGLGRVPALVKDVNDNESLVLALVENVQRADLSPLEEAHAYRALLEEFSLTQDQVAERVGKSRPAVTNTLRLLQLPVELQQEISAGRITAGHARALLALDQPAAQSALAREIVQRKLSVRDAEKVALRARSRQHATAGDPDVTLLEGDLARVLGTKVTIQPDRGSKGRGRLTLDYYSHDDLARLAGLLLGGKRRVAVP